MNIFENLNIPKVGENFEALYEKDGILIERIISSDTPDIKEYSQPYDEWLVLLKGEATLEINHEMILLEVGDTKLIKKDTPHKVISTKKGTIWLCIHLKNR
ncbi:cupin domain-containing protein [Sulfurospirillum arcachonense]|uniref:cupin domain-containing protein n=1 Tax=Sulfurospirillum arcachonense TaxID=57666 RepID=UPI000468E5C0|nr:cupin domain-containing protein [Sulfurospirillum arcachonense]